MPSAKKPSTASGKAPNERSVSSRSLASDKSKKKYIPPPSKQPAADRERSAVGKRKTSTSTAAAKKPLSRTKKSIHGSVSYNKGAAQKK